ncbi:MAG: DUF134 domain-containing protein [Spirochaetes bacterium]|nr:DUF134 domain-containing protein [Spirochaetota bacterium]
MPRRKKCRNLQGPPGCNSFKPKGIPGKFLKKVIISLDEYESIRLADYDNLDHEGAAVKLGVSRSVFTRLVDTARKKVAVALIEGCELSIEGGEYHFQKKYFRCMQCYRISETGIDNNDLTDCPYCGSYNMHNLNTDFGLKGQCRRHGY